jgi:dihydroorotase
VYAGTGARGIIAGDSSVYPDGFTFRAGMTTVVDAGSAGAQNFADFKDRVIDRSRTRVLAFLNIVRAGMSGTIEQNTAEMVPEDAVAAAKRYPGLIVGFKTAHYAAADWIAVERTVEAGRQASLPVMVDFGNNHPERPLKDLLLIKLRPGDIYTHVYSGLRNEQDETGHVNPALPEARKRGIIFDVGHGGGSFLWRIAVPAIKEGFVPDSISTDLHTGSMNTGMKDMLNVMSKFLVMGLSLEDVILRSTWNPAKEIRHEELGHLSAGAPADLTVLRLEEGSFGFLDTYGARLRGSQKLTCELTIRDGRVVYDLNGIAATDWDKLDPNYGPQGARRPAGARSTASPKSKKGTIR